MSEFGSLAESRARVRAQVAAADARFAAMETLGDRAQTATASAQSPNGEVTVTARAVGDIVDIKFNPSLSLPLPKVAEVLVSTIAAAQRAAAQAGIELAREALGPDSDYVARLQAQVNNRFEM